MTRFCVISFCAYNCSRPSSSSATRPSELLLGLRLQAQALDLFRVLLDALAELRAQAVARLDTRIEVPGLRSHHRGERRFRESLGDEARHLEDRRAVPLGLEAGLPDHKGIERVVDDTQVRAGHIVIEAQDDVALPHQLTIADGDFLDDAARAGAAPS